LKNKKLKSMSGKGTEELTRGSSMDEKGDFCGNFSAK
jgi:hypothetical protein